MADATLASSTASLPQHQLPSFASSFHPEDYDRPPPGISQADWVRLARARGGPSTSGHPPADSSTASSVPAAQYDYSAQDSVDLDEPSSRPRGGYSPATTSSKQTRSTAAAHRDSSSAAGFDESDSADRTETTAHHVRLGRDLSTASDSRTTGDESSFAAMYGTTTGARAKSKGSASSGGGAMSLREQEKVSKVADVRACVCHVADRERPCRSSTS